jgi:putative phage-type endonuclease
MSEQIKPFLEERRNGLGGSDIAAVLGISPYKSAYELYEEKVNGVQADLSNNEAVIWGNLLEEPIAQYYEQLIGKQLYCSSTFKHEKYPFLIANPDRLVMFEKRGLEIKTTNEHLKHLWGESGSQQIPEYYYAQISHYMLVLDYPVWDVAVLIGGQEIRTYTFERDKEIEGIIIEQANDFWHNNVLAKKAPPIDYSKPGVRELIKRKFNLVSDVKVELPSEFVEITDQYEKAKSQISQNEKLKDMLEAMILEKMGNAGIGRLVDGRKFIRKKVERKAFNVKASSYTSLTLKGAKS